MMEPEEIEQAVGELRTVRDFLRWGASRFNAAGLVFGHGTDNAWDEAVVLVTHALHLPPDASPEILDARLTRAEREAVAALLARRVDERKPASYLIGRAWFAGLAFYVDERVLIPRSPLAELIERGFTPWLDPDAVGEVLDIGTGSGCIAVACAVAFPAARITATDTSAEALDVAHLNVAAYGLQDRIRLAQGDLFAGADDRAYDLIVANPPYVDAEEMAALPPEYRHEPAAALAAGEHGLDYALPLLREAPQYLVPGGLLALEVGASEAALERRCPEVPFTWVSLERGGSGVCVITREQLVEHAAAFA